MEGPKPMRVCNGSSGAESRATRTKPRQTCTTRGSVKKKSQPPQFGSDSNSRAEALGQVGHSPFAECVLHLKLQLQYCFRPLRTLADNPCNSCRSRDRCFLPIAAALAFRDTPGLVAPAVRAFCSGDPADKKLGVRMARLLALPASAAEVKAAGNAKCGSQPEAPLFVEARIAFTRHLYAQLHQAAVVPAKAFPPG